MIFQNITLPDHPLKEITGFAARADFADQEFDLNAITADALKLTATDIPCAHYGRRTRWPLDLSIRPTAAVIYPPGGGMGWHTNSNQPGWRAYLAWSETGDSGMGWLRDGQVVLDYDAPGWNVRLFQVPAWHCVFAHCWRCSIGVRPEQGQVS